MAPIPIEQVDEWQTLAEAASDVYGGVLPGGGTLGYDTNIPCGTRNQFEHRADAEFCSRARGIVLMLAAEVRRLRTEITRLGYYCGICHAAPGESCACPGRDV